MYIRTTSLLLANVALASTAALAAPRQDAGPSAPAAATAGADPKLVKGAEKEAAKQQKALVAQYGLGPYPAETDAFVGAKPEPLRGLYKSLYTGGERNSVLNFQRLGFAAIVAGQWKEANWAFDGALNRIEAIFGDSAGAKAARSIFHNESNKDYKGEPYERAMAYYYRGLLYLRDGDYGNARASFKSAEYQDTLSEAETFQSDFAVMNYLIGWTQMCDGQVSSAREAFAIAAKAEPGLVAPSPGDNVLFITELGNGPLKARDGASGQKLIFQAGAEYPEVASSILLSEGKAMNEIKLIKASSVHFQATTRGGRAIDGIQGGKATVKEGTSAVGDALMNEGLSGNGSSAMLVAGGLMKMFGSAVKTKADMRAWDGLPDLIMVGTARVKSADWTAKAAFLDRNDTVVASDGPTMRGGDKACSIVWSRSRPVTYGEAVYGDDEGVVNAVRKKKDVQAKDKQFRTLLDS